MGKGKSVTHMVDKEWCKGCGICVHFCPKQVLELDKQGKAEAVRPEDCLGSKCMLCELRCPDLAIQIKETGEGEDD
jgi:2-oxoglutarate ferredoxin oxidoreductase subunit delta